MADIYQAAFVVYGVLRPIIGSASPYFSGPFSCGLLLSSMQITASHGVRLVIAVFVSSITGLFGNIV
jgi:hypothetical protein